MLSCQTPNGKPGENKEDVVKGSFSYSKQEFRKKLHDIEREGKHIAQRAEAALKGIHNKDTSLQDIYTEGLNIANQAANLSSDLLNIL